MTSALSTRSRGFSLIELMIAITIGLVIVAAIGYMFQTSKVSYNTSQGMARMQENGRSAQIIFAAVVRQAGYIDDPIGYNDPSKVFSSGNGDLAIFGGAPSTLASNFSWVTPTLGYTTATVDENGLSINSDFLEVAFVGGDSGLMNDCQGHSILNTQISINVFYVDKQSSDTVPSLYCAAKIVLLAAPGTNTGSGPYAGVPLIAGISGLQVKYGIDSNQDSAIDYYATNAAVSDWTTVRSLTVRLTGQSTEQALASASSATAITASSSVTFGSQTNDTETVHKGYLTRPIIATFFVRNRLALYKP